MGKQENGKNRNFLQQQFHTGQPNQIWVSDIDLFSRKIISYRISQNSSTQLLTKTFKQAYSERKPERGLMFHSDRGTQYMSYTFVHLLEDFGVKQSFSRTARPHDNAVRRSVFLNPQKRRTISAALYFRSGSDKRYSSVY